MGQAQKEPRQNFRQKSAQAHEIHGKARELVESLHDPRLWFLSMLFAKAVRTIQEDTLAYQPCLSLAEKPQKNAHRNC